MWPEAAGLFLHDFMHYTQVQTPIMNKFLNDYIMSKLC